MTIHSEKYSLISLNFIFQPISRHNGNIRLEVHDSVSPSFSSRSLPSASICTVSAVWHSTQTAKTVLNLPWTVEKWNWLLLLQVQKDSNTQTISKSCFCCLVHRTEAKKAYCLYFRWIIYGLFFSFKLDWLYSNSLQGLKLSSMTSLVHVILSFFYCALSFWPRLCRIALAP